MTSNENIEKYLNKELSQKDLDTFKQRLADETDLQSEFKLRKEIEDALEQTDFKLFQETLDKIVQKDLPKHKRIRRLSMKNSNVRWYMVAASIAIIFIGANVMFVLNDKNYEPQELYSMYYKPYDSYTSVRSGNLNTEDMFIQALIKYENQEYDQTISLLSKVLEVDSKNLASQFYLGVAYIETGKFDEAYRSFQKIIDDGDNLFAEQAEWYLGMTYLRQDFTELAKQQFNDIAQGQSYYKQKAVEILASL